MSDDVDERILHGYHEGDDDYVPEGLMRRSEILMSSDKDDAIKYCIAASLILHILFFGLIVRGINPGSTKPIAKPKDNVTSVRLVNPPNAPKEKEPPPEAASAISDRDHTAKVQKLPKKPPEPAAPIGRILPREQKLAALKPPPAPEDLIKPKEDVVRKPEAKKPAKPDKQQKDKPEKPQTTAGRTPPKQAPRNRNVDLRPTPAEIARGLTPHGASSDFFPDGDPEEVVVDINTRDNKFFSYLNHLKQKIQLVWVYPSAAARSGIGGTLTIEFSVSRSGELIFVNLLDSSGHAILDHSALTAIKAAAPYDPFPARLKAKRIRVRANFHYLTGDFFRRVL
ncbi:MAG: TonB family protein [Pseudomonadota bacterium]